MSSPNSKIKVKLQFELMGSATVEDLFFEFFEFGFILKPEFSIWFDWVIKLKERLLPLSGQFFLSFLMLLFRERQGTSDREMPTPDIHPIFAVTTLSGSYTMPCEIQKETLVRRRGIALPSNSPGRCPTKGDLHQNTFRIQMPVDQAARLHHA
ncbi:MAG: hypothetical protein ABJM29_20150 [Rhizobiaceae bacterium]